MTEFWFAAGAMIAAALAVALPPFLRPRRPPEDNSRRENIAAAREDLRELQNREMPEKEADEYESEIKMRLLRDAGESVPPKSAARPPAADKAGAILVCLLLLFGAPALYLHLGAPRAMSAAPPPDLDAAIAGLRLHIAENPADAEALALMGRTLTALGREKEAAEYFARARAAQNKSENDITPPR